MKKCLQKNHLKFLLLLLLFTQLFVKAVKAQTIIIDANPGTSGNVIVGNSNYHVMEAIYLESEIGASNFTTTTNPIRSISFSLNSANTATLSIPSSYKIYLKNVSSGTTTLATGAYSTSGYTLVYNGSLNISDTGYFSINLSTTFKRTSGNNLQMLIERMNNTPYNPAPIFNCSVGNSTSVSALSVRRYNGTVLPVSGTTSLTTSSFRPKIKISSSFATIAPSVSTNSPSLITSYSANLGGDVSDSGTSNITQRGIVYGANLNPTLVDSKISLGTGLGSFSQNVTGLTSSTLYHVRAFAINGTDTSYGADSSFTTLVGSPIAANVTVGAGGTYPSFTNAGGLFEAINNGVVNQNVTATVISNTNELGTHQLNQFSTNYSLTIIPNSATLRTIDMASPTRASDSLFVFDGADNVKIDGSFNGSGRYLLFRCANANVDSTGSVFVLRNDAREISISNCIIESNAKNYNSPVIFIGKTNLPWGNDGFTLNGNLIRESTGSNTGGYSYGLQNSSSYPYTIAQKNSRMSIRKNQFTGFMNTAGVISIINISTAGDSLIIDSNQIYRGSNYTLPNLQSFTCINTDGGSNATITNNSIGGSNPNRSGNAITCSAQFLGIITNTTDTGSLTYISNNRISNIACVGNNADLSLISIRGDKIIITNNVIGGLENPWDSIQGSGKMIEAIPDGFKKPDTTFVSYNKVSGIFYKGKVVKGLTGINIFKIVTNSPEVIYCNNNIVSDMYSNSVAFKTGTGELLGININVPLNGSRNAFIYNNEVRGLFHTADTNRYNANHIAGMVTGIKFSGGPSTIYKAQLYNNKVYELGSNSNLLNTPDTGIFSAQVNGVSCNQIFGNLIVYNNQVSLVSNNLNPVKYFGITCKDNNTNFQGNLRIIYNSVSLSGNNENSYSAAFNRDFKQTIYVRNNIFMNAKTGSNRHFAIVNDSMSTNWTDTSCQHNLFISPSSNQMGLWVDRSNPLNFAAWKTASNSDSASAYYTSVGITSPNSFFTDHQGCNLTLKTISRSYVAGKGYPEPDINTDWNADTRSATNPSVGAFEYSLAPALAPTVITTSRTSITTTSATLAGNATDSGTSTITERGVVYATSTNPTTANTKIAIGSGLGTYSQNVTGLTPNTLYHVRAYAINNVGTSYGFDSTFTTLSLSETYPTVITSKPSLIGVYSALLGGSVVDSGSSSIIERGVVYATTLNPTTANNKNVFASSAVVAKIITGLTPNTLYHVRYYAINSTGISYGGDSTFTTLSIPTLAPSVITLKTTSIGITNATLSGNVTDSGTNIVTERGVVYATTADPTTTDTKIIIGSGLGTFSQNVTGLLPSTTYHVRAYAINSVGTSYGADSVFTTLSAIAPTVSTGGITSIGITNVTLSGNVTDSGTNAVTERGVIYATTINPTTANTKVAMGSGLGSFSQNVTGLLPSTTYHVRAYAINSAGISYGADSIFTTLPAPTVANVITGNVTNISNTSASLAGNVIADGGASVTERGIVLATTANPTTANTKVTIGSGLGNFSQIITALTPNTTYHYRAYAINSVGTSYGADSVFTTLPNPEFNKNIINAFSPDGDGTNDTWVIDNADMLDGHEITVYNIFGQVLFTQTGYSTPWDGKKDGNPVPSGEYYYHIKGSKINIKGALLIKNNQ